MKNLFFALAAFAFFALQSCSVDSNVHFNKDWSGKSSTEIDLSKMMAFAQGMSDEGDDSKKLNELLGMISKENRPDSVQQDINSLNKELNKKGIRNFDFFTSNNQTLGMEFNFDDINAINQSDLSELFDKIDQDSSSTTDLNEELGPMGKMTSVSYKTIGKKKLVIDLSGGASYEDMINDMMQPDPEDPEDKGMTKEEAEMALEMTMGMMSSMMDFNNTYTFERKIKTVESNLPVKYKKNGKELTLNFSLGEFIDALKENNKAEVVVTLK